MSQLQVRLLWQWTRSRLQAIQGKCPQSRMSWTARLVASLVCFSLRESLSTEQNRCHELYEEVERLRGEGRYHRDEIRRLSEARTNEPNPASSPGEAEAVVPG